LFVFLRVSDADIVGERKLLYFAGGLSRKDAPDAPTNNGRQRTVQAGRLPKFTRHYVRIRAERGRDGTPIGNMDVLIASHVLSQGMI